MRAPLAAIPDYTLQIKIVASDGCWQEYEEPGFYFLIS